MFLVIVGATVAAALILNALLNRLVRLGSRFVAAGTFLVVGTGAYSMSFVFDMIALASAGMLPRANIVWPCITWSMFTVSSLLVGASRVVPFAVRAAPFWLIGGLMVLSPFTHRRPPAWGLILLLVGTAYAAVASGKISHDGKSRHGLAPAIGPYRIDMKTENIANLVELTPDEIAALNASITFKNERLYNVPSPQFAKAHWEVIIGAVDGRVYKISALLSLPDAAARDREWQTLDHLFRTSLGLGAPASAERNLMVWDTQDGNVVMNRVDTNEYILVLTLTSRAVRGFVPAR